MNQRNQQNHLPVQLTEIGIVCRFYGSRRGFENGFGVNRNVDCGVGYVNDGEEIVNARAVMSQIDNNS